MGSHAPLTDRLWRNVDRSAGPDACWLWLGAVDRKGYGAIRGPGPVHRVLKTHRVAYAAVNGSLSDEECVLHRCDIPPCCNPTHLFLGTITDNNRDMWRKGRGKTGWERRRRNAKGQFVAKGVA